MNVFIYVDTSKEVGDPDHLKVFATADAADTWLEENAPEGLAFEYEVLEWKKARRLPLLTSGAPIVQQKDKVCVAARMGRRPKLEVIVDRAAVAERAAGSCGGVVALKITCHPSDALIN